MWHVNPSHIAALKALTDPTRLRIVGSLARGAANLDELVDAIGGRRGDVVRHIGVLRAAGLIAEDAAGRLALRQETLMTLGRELDGLHRAAEHRADRAFEAGEGVDPEDGKVLRAFIVEGRLASIPTTDRKRLVILRYLRDECFTEDRPYPEKEVNQRLALFHPDVASLRRHMVDAGFMTRDAGLYRRRTEDPP